MLKKFLKDEMGATAIEYALIATFVSVSIVLGATQIGSKLASQFFTTVASNLK